MEKRLSLLFGIIGSLVLLISPLGLSMIFGSIRGYVTEILFSILTILGFIFIIYFSILLIIDTIKTIHKK
ncbi:hypothetical protein [Clostridium chromiireducens]|uniref:Uncharacterized protein n=1 Tax=Clostridium chromiireducens TaxID=225345 RepID=A0A1V4IH26_9CLOT|nr:hypothetical protein [Clostridium chromiireducens]OPJ59253.1 hypothetical protein CLCHR_35660 [Clostridium chromiireducens]